MHDIEQGSICGFKYQKVTYIFMDQYRFLENFSWFMLDPRNPQKLAPHENYHPYGIYASSTRVHFSIVCIVPSAFKDI